MISTRGVDHRLTERTRFAAKQLADEVFYAACPTEGEADWTIMYENDHEGGNHAVRWRDREEGDDQRSFDHLEHRCQLEGTIRLRGNEYCVTRTDDEEAECLQKASFAFALYMDCWRKEPKRGVTIAYTPKESCTDKRHHTFIVAPKHRDVIQCVTTGALQADAAHIMVPADVSAKADPWNGVYTDEASCDNQADCTWCRFAGEPSM